MDPSASALQPPIPVLRIFSVEKAFEFYCDYLAFNRDWEHRFDPMAPLYVQVSRGQAVLHLTEHHGDACPGAAVLIGIRGIDALAEELAGKDYRYARPAVETAPWGARILNVIDPFGNRLTFNERSSN